MFVDSCRIVKNKLTGSTDPIELNGVFNGRGAAWGAAGGGDLMESTKKVSSLK